MKPIITCGDWKDWLESLQRLVTKFYKSTEDIAYSDATQDFCWVKMQTVTQLYSKYIQNTCKCVKFQKNRVRVHLVDDSFFNSFRLKF